MGAKDCSRPPGSDIWAHFAGFLAELIAKDRGVSPNVSTFRRAGTS